MKHIVAVSIMKHTRFGGGVISVPRLGLIFPCSSCTTTFRTISYIQLLQILKPNPNFYNLSLLLLRTRKELSFDYGFLFDEPFPTFLI
jgi:hypothetical protein